MVQGIDEEDGIERVGLLRKGFSRALLLVSVQPRGCVRVPYKPPVKIPYIPLRSRNLSPPALCHCRFPSCAPTVIRGPHKPGVVRPAIELTKLRHFRSLRPEPSGGRVHQLSGSLHWGNCVVFGNYLVAVLFRG